MIELKNPVVTCPLTFPPLGYTNKNLTRIKHFTLLEY